MAMGNARQCLIAVVPAGARARRGAQGWFTYDCSVAGAVTADPGSQQLAGVGWTLRADRVEMLSGDRRR
jgi:hypothetical protein